MVGANVLSKLEPKPGRLVEHLTLMRNGSKDLIKSRLAVSGDHNPPPVG